jgi:hypothetical protein
MTGYDGCSRDCGKAGAHTLVWGRCEFGREPPPPGPVLPVVHLADDGFMALRYDPITWEQAESMLRPTGSPRSTYCYKKENVMVRVRYELECHCGGKMHRDVGHTDPDTAVVTIDLEMAVQQQEFYCDECECITYTGDLDTVVEPAECPSSNLSEDDDD